MNKVLEFLLGVTFISKDEIGRAFNAGKYKAPTKEVSDIVNQMNEKGIYAIENYYSAEKCKSIVEEIERKNIEYKSKVWVDDQDADHRLFGIDRVSDLIELFYKDNFITTVMNAYLNSAKAITGFTLAGKIRATDNNIGSGGGWHRDIVFGKQFKAIIYLTDTDQDNGPFQYLDNTHTHSVLIDNIINSNIRARQNRLTDKNIEDIIATSKYELKTMTGKAGTLLLVDTSGIHRGKPIKKGTRYALTNYYFEGPIPSIFDLAK